MTETIVVNADDFGRSRTRNFAIDKCIKDGYVNQTSLMVNMGQYTEDAVQMAFDGGYADCVVLHINLTLGEPLTEKIKNTPFCRDGVFDGIRNLENILAASKEDSTKQCREAIREECEAQIQKFLQYGFKPFHLDSHNWIHLEIPVWKELKPLMIKYGVSSVRPMRKGFKYTKFKSLYGFAKYILLSRRAVAENIYYLISDLLIKTGGLCKNSYSGNLEEFLDEKKTYKFAEVFCHPDYKENDIYDLSWSYKGDDYRLMSDFHNELKKCCNQRRTYKQNFKILGENCEK